jgi:hypothetical protein
MKAHNMADRFDRILTQMKALVKDTNRCVATPLRTGGARWAARDHPARGAFLLQLRVPVLELWLSHLQQQTQDHCTLAVQNPMHPPHRLLRT